MREMYELICKFMCLGMTIYPDIGAEDNALMIEPCHTSQRSRPKEFIEELMEIISKYSTSGEGYVEG